ncbi:MAG: C39 family peptidase [Anaerolineales bacterium]|jgi:hypothetical protein
MTEPERTALEHIRQVVNSVIGGSTALPVHSPEQEMPGKVPLLPVPYVSQLGEGADQFSNDTGAAAGVMLLQAYTAKSLTPNDFFKQSGQQADMPLSLQQIASVLSANGVAVEQRSALKLGDLALVLTTGRPVILLVRYAILQQAGLAPETYNGAHYLVAVGLDLKNIYVHDPFRYDNSGQGQAIPWLVLFQAWTRAPDFERAALIPRLPLVRRVIVTSSSLTIRSEPNPQAALAGRARAGDVYEVTAQKDGWGRIGDGLWIEMKYLADI